MSEIYDIISPVSGIKIAEIDKKIIDTPSKFPGQVLTKYIPEGNDDVKILNIYDLYFNKCKFQNNYNIGEDGIQNIDDLINYLYNKYNYQITSKKGIPGIQGPQGEFGPQGEIGIWIYNPKNIENNNGEIDEINNKLNGCQSNYNEYTDSDKQKYLNKYNNLLTIKDQFNSANSNYFKNHNNNLSINSSLHGNDAWNSGYNIHYNTKKTNSELRCLSYYYKSKREKYLYIFDKNGHLVDILNDYNKFNINKTSIDTIELNTCLSNFTVSDNNSNSVNIYYYCETLENIISDINKNTLYKIEYNTNPKNPIKIHISPCIKSDNEEQYILQKELLNIKDILISNVWAGYQDNEISNQIKDYCKYYLLTTADNSYTVSNITTNSKYKQLDNNIWFDFSSIIWNNNSTILSTTLYLYIIYNNTILTFSDRNKYSTITVNKINDSQPVYNVDISSYLNNINFICKNNNNEECDYNDYNVLIKQNNYILLQYNNVNTNNCNIYMSGLWKYLSGDNFINPQVKLGNININKYAIGGISINTSGTDIENSLDYRWFDENNNVKLLIDPSSNTGWAQSKNLNYSINFNYKDNNNNQKIYNLSDKYAYIKLSDFKSIGVTIGVNNKELTTGYKYAVTHSGNVGTNNYLNNLNTSLPSIKIHNYNDSYVLPIQINLQTLNNSGTTNIKITFVGEQNNNVFNSDSSLWGYNLKDYFIDDYNSNNILPNITYTLKPMKPENIKITGISEV